MSSGGSRSRAAKARLNQAARQFGLGYQVVTRAKAWVVQTNLGTYRYNDEMCISRSLDGNDELVTYPQHESQGHIGLVRYSKTLAAGSNRGAVSR